MESAFEWGIINSQRVNENTMNKLMQKLVLFLSAMLVFCCVFINLKYSSTMEIWGNCSEYVQIGKNPSFFQVCVILMTGLFYYWFINSHHFEKIRIHRIKMITLMILLLEGYLWITHVYVIPGADSGQLINAAHAFSQGDYTLFEPGQYFYKNPHQLGFTLFLQCFSGVFGEYQYTKLMTFNVIVLVISCSYLMKIAEKLFPSKENQLLVCLLLLGFFPAIFYCSFIYGVYPGLMASIIGIWYFMEYIDSNRFDKLIISGVFMGMAYLLKPNYAIFIVALLIIFFIDMLSKKKIKLIQFVVFAALCLLPLKTVNGYYEQKLNQSLDGFPMLSYLVMSTKESDIAPGWWNWYKEIVYDESGQNLHKMGELVQEDLKEQIQFYINNPTEFFDHYSKKTISQWAESSYQSIWLSEVRYSMGHYYQEFDEVGKWVYFKGKGLLRTMMDCYNTVLYCGAFLGIMHLFKENDSKKMILPLIFTGGFLYHLLFEAKSQYLIIYAIILIPYAASGINLVLFKIKQGIKRREQQ